MINDLIIRYKDIGRTQDEGPSSVSKCQSTENPMYRKTETKIARMESGRACQWVFRNRHKSLKNGAFNLSPCVGVPRPQKAYFSQGTSIGQIRRVWHGLSANSTSRGNVRHETFVRLSAIRNVEFGVRHDAGRPNLAARTSWASVMVPTLLKISGKRTLFRTRREVSGSNSTRRITLRRDTKTASFSSGGSILGQKRARKRCHGN